MVFSTKIFLSEIGIGWEPVVLGTEEEHDFIKEGQKSFYRSAPYWIGGSANASLHAVFKYSDYIKNNSGNYHRVTVLFHYLDFYNKPVFPKKPGQLVKILSLLKWKAT